MSEKPLPAPLLPSTVDLRDYDWMPLDVNRLRKSETRMRTKPEEFRAAIMLWCAAWHEVPAGSLPDDEMVLADLAGYGVAVKEWRKVRTGALRGFVKCSDGRLYHPVVVEKAISSWLSKLEQKHRSVCGKLRKWKQRHKDDPVDIPTFEVWITGAYPESVPLMSMGHGRNVPEDTDQMSSGHTPNVPDLFAPKEMRGEEIESLNQHQRLQASAASPPVDNPGPKAPRSTPRAGDRWRLDPQAAMRKLTQLGLTSWSHGKTHADCVQRIEQVLAERQRGSA